MQAVVKRFRSVAVNAATGHNGDMGAFSDENFIENDIGNAFWNRIGWTQRLDLNYYDFVLNKENIEAFNE